MEGSLKRSAASWCVGTKIWWLSWHIALPRSPLNTCKYQFKRGKLASSSRNLCYPRIVVSSLNESATAKSSMFQFQWLDYRLPDRSAHAHLVVRTTLWNHNAIIIFYLLCRELKDNLGNDEPEGDMPILLQALLSRNPKVFGDKSMLSQ